MFLSILFLFLSSAVLASGIKDDEPLTISGGEIDLTTYHSKVIRLSGEWLFYDNTFLDPGQPLPPGGETCILPGPVFFNNGRFGYGTLVLKIHVPEDNYVHYGFFLPRFLSANRVYINGKEVLSSGKVGTAREEEEVNSFSSVIPIQAGLSDITIMIHNSNFTDLSGGTRNRIYFGELKPLQNYRSYTNFISIGLIGSFIMIGFYHLLFYLFRPQEKTALYSSLFAFFISKRIFLVDLTAQIDLLPLMEHFPHVLLRRIEYIGFYSLVLLFILFYYHIFPEKRTRVFKNISVILTVVTIIPVLFTSFRTFNNLLIVNQIYTFLCGIFITYDLLYRSFKKSSEAQFLLISFFFLFTAVTIDSLSNRFVFVMPPLTPAGYYFFIIIQGLVLSRKYALAFNDVEMISGDLDRLLIERKGYETLLEKKVKERTEDLSLALAIARTANQEKGDFLARMSHEIRTPLNGIMGFAEIINESKDRFKRKKFAKMIVRESENLLTLINQLLDISKIDAGEMTIEKKPTDINKLINSVIQIYQPIIHNKGLALETEIPEFESLFIIDGDRLHQALCHIIGNSCKFTEQGKIRLSVAMVYDKDEESELLFIIQDTGIGIPKEKQSDIVKGFIQADSSLTRRFGGTGLGTTISKSLIEMIGGEMGFDSSPGKGSSFWFRLPVQKHKKTERKSTRKPQKTKLDMELDVLLVEDYMANQLVAKRHLENAGCNVEIAENGQEAIDLASKKNYDVICMDLHMPVMDGFKATQEIRKSDDGKKIIIIGLTADAYEETRTKCLQCGMNDVITKPLRKKQFLNVVAQWTAF